MKDTQKEIVVKGLEQPRVEYYLDARTGLLCFHTCSTAPLWGPYPAIVTIVYWHRRRQKEPALELKMAAMFFWS